MLFSREFYTQNACEVARQLIGAVLVRQIHGQRVSGRIVETEAYTGGDLASHGRAGKTPRNLPMWEAPGFAYVYFTYGVHWMLNVVCEPEGQAAAVLIRAVQPLDGQDMMARNRHPLPARLWTNGPARLTKAYGVTGAENRTDMTALAGKLWIEQGDSVPEHQVRTGPRIGLGKNVPEPWLSIPWRWWVDGNPYVSR